jgi:hypothetical protein
VADGGTRYTILGCVRLVDDGHCLHLVPAGVEDVQALFLWWIEARVPILGMDGYCLVRLVCAGM